MTPIPTSLRYVPSERTESERESDLHRDQVRLWHEKGGVLLFESDPDFGYAAKIIGEQRFGKRGA